MLIIIIEYFPMEKVHSGEGYIQAFPDYHQP